MALLAGSLLFTAGQVPGAEVTPDRLANADREPHNWPLRGGFIRFLASPQAKDTFAAAAAD
jgi:hypothetical protein